MSAGASARAGSATNPASSSPGSRRRNIRPGEVVARIVFKADRVASAVLKLHILGLEKGLQFRDAEIGEDFTLPVEDRRLGLAGGPFHLVERHGILADIFLPVADAMRGKELDDLAAPRAAGLDIKDGQYGGHADRGGFARTFYRTGSRARTVRATGEAVVLGELHAPSAAVFARER